MTNTSFKLITVPGMKTIEVKFRVNYNSRQKTFNTFKEALRYAEAHKVSTIETIYEKI